MPPKWFKCVYFDNNYVICFLRLTPESKNIYHNVSCFSRGTENRKNYFRNLIALPWDFVPLRRSNIT